MEPLEQLRQDFTEHAAQDAANFAALHKTLDGLATKKDIAELKRFMGNVNIGLGIFRFTWNNANKIGAFVLFILGSYLLIKYGLVTAVVYFFRLTTGNL